MSESKEITPHNGDRRAVATASVDSARGMLAMIAEAARDPSVDADKMVTLARLATDMQDRERQSEFNRDKMAAIQEMPAIFKRGQNTHTGTKYAKFEDLHRAVMPILARHNLVIDFRIGSAGRDITVQPILRHGNGHVEEGGIMQGPPDEGKGRSSIQAVGSASSYLKRYSMRAMLNIIEDGEDDDGNGGARIHDQINDRQADMINEAQAAMDRGEYVGFFGKLSPKDKAWMITTGRHAQFGGGTALAAPSQSGASDPKPSDPEPSQQTAKRQTPDEWVAQFISDVRVTLDRTALADLQRKSQRALDKLQSNEPELFAKCDQAITDRNFELDADESGPADTQRGEGATLFGEGE